MALRAEISEDPISLMGQELIYVAVGKDVKECRSVLFWALQNSGGNRICILHVHQPAQLIPFMGTKAPASSVDSKVVRDYRETERKRMHGILIEYLLICRQMGVQAQKLLIEMDCVERGIVTLISQHRIKKLVMGAAAEKQYRRNMTDLRSDKAKYVSQQAPVWCHIQFVCKGHLIFTREAIAETETGKSYQRRSLSSVTWRHDRNGSRRKDSGTTSSPKSMLDMGGSPHEQDGLSRSPPDLGCASCSAREGVGLRVSPLSDDENGLTFSTLSPTLSYSRKSSAGKISLSLQKATLTLTSGRDGSPEISALCEKLQHAMVEAEKEIHRRQNAERGIEALRRAQEELIQRKAEGALAKEKELEDVKIQRNQLMEDLQLFKEQEIDLKSHITELQKMIDELLVKRDSSLKDAEGLRRKQKSSIENVPEFFEFSLSDIQEATENFSEILKIGEGGYGIIYKGVLCQTEVAIKRLNPQRLDSHGAQGPSEFQTEIHILRQLRHPNLVKLIGSCLEVFALVYEYLPNGSLEDRLNCKDNSPPLSWQTRIRIATELCSVLMYLHSTKPHSIVHGDLKPSNILLDASLVSKLSDFGICRTLFPELSSCHKRKLCHETVPKGTLPYIDPEFLGTGVLTLKSDVYAFGVILLQLLSGRKPFSIANDVKNYLDAGNLKALLDPLAGDWPTDLARKLARLGLRCCERKPKSRPELKSDVWKALEPMNASCAALSLSQAGTWR